MWGKADWDSLERPIEDLRIPPAPPSPSPDQLDSWFAHFLDTLTAVVRLHTPVSRPSPKSKPWWTPSLTALRKEYAKARRLPRKHRTEAYISLARLSRQGYFKAIKKAKNSHWAEFLGRTTPHNIWRVKKFVTTRKTPRFPDLPGANSPVEINKALLNHFFPPKTLAPTKGPLPPPPLSRPAHQEGDRCRSGQILPLIRTGPRRTTLLSLEEGERHEP